MIVTLCEAWVVISKELYLVRDCIEEHIGMSSGCFGRSDMDPQYHGYAPYFYAAPRHQLTTMYHRPQVVPMFMPCIQQPDMPKATKSFSIDDILRRPHPSTCMAANRSYFPRTSEVTETVDYNRFGQVPFWERGMWQHALSETHTGKSVASFQGVNKLFLFLPNIRYIR
jgi:hypothetical protein